jgi:hypothetical protein
MTTQNIPLQQRAGNNIGNESLPPFIHGAAMPETAVNVSGNTTLMEGQDKVVRTPSVRTIAGNFGAVINQTANTYDCVVLFVDDEGNEMPLGDFTVNPNSLGELNLEGYFAEGLFLGLCPGEKIILNTALGGGS